VDVAMIDLRMPEVGGLEVLRAIREADSRCQAILMTGFATIDTAVEAIKLGAMDYLNKPLDFARVEQLLAAVREEIERRKRLMAIETDVARRLEFCGMVGRSPVMQELFGLVRRLAPHVHVAVITGETGTGKELVARGLHQLGPRRENRFVTINCSAVVETLFESELFGHVRGAFTGASETKPGLFEVADGGTIFLDEIGELPLTVQAKLLRVLESGEVNRVGSLESRKVNVHIIAATNRDLRAEVAAGRFRSDLYYRLNVIALHVPPLRDRRDDIPILTHHFLSREAAAHSTVERELSDATMELLIKYDWPGNVRELENALERAAVVSQSGVIQPDALPDRVRSAPMPQLIADAQPANPPMEVIERAYIHWVLQAEGGNKTRAAEVLGIDPSTLYRKLNRYGIEV
jgi:two-component system response regulator HydG